MKVYYVPSPIFGPWDLSVKKNRTSNSLPIQGQISWASHSDFTRWCPRSRKISNGGSWWDTENLKEKPAIDIIWFQCKQVQQNVRADMGTVQSRGVRIEKVNFLWEGGPTAHSQSEQGCRSGSMGVWMDPWRQPEPGPCKDPPAGCRGRSATAEGDKQDGTEIWVEWNWKWLWPPYRTGKGKSRQCGKTGSRPRGTVRGGGWKRLPQGRGCGKRREGMNGTAQENPSGWRDWARTVRAWRKYKFRRFEPEIPGWLWCNQLIQENRRHSIFWGQVKGFNVQTEH